MTAQGLEEELLRRWFPHGNTVVEQEFTELDIQEISTVLDRCGNNAWSHAPRLYIVLRCINRLDVIDSVISQCVSDIWFPFTKSTVPKCLQESDRTEFLLKQDLVCHTKALNLEKAGASHGHFRDARDIPLKKLGDLGKGASGFVERVLSTVTYREYALKLIKRGQTFRKDKQVLRDFEKELAHLKKVSQSQAHRHIIELVGSFTDPRYVGILFPVADCNLIERLEVVQLRDERSSLRSYFGCLADGLRFLHDNRIRHKDIKPQNILIKNGEPLFTDFGIAVDWTEAGLSTTEGPAALTPRYSAPEVAAYSPRNWSSDIWSLGCVYLEICTVLRGATLEDLETAFTREGYLRPYHSTDIDVVSWIKSLRVLPGQVADNIAFDWISGMLVRQRNDRWSPSKLSETIREHSTVSSTRFLYLCRHCLEDEDSVESVISDEDEDQVVHESGLPLGDDTPAQRDSEASKSASTSRIQKSVKETAATEARSITIANTRRKYQARVSDASEESSASDPESPLSRKDPPMVPRMHSPVVPNVDSLADHNARAQGKSAQERTHRHESTAKDRAEGPSFGRPLRLSMRKGFDPRTAGPDEGQAKSAYRTHAQDSIIAYTRAEDVGAPKADHLRKEATERTLVGSVPTTPPSVQEPTTRQPPLPVVRTCIFGDDYVYTIIPSSLTSREALQVLNLTFSDHHNGYVIKGRLTKDKVSAVIRLSATLSSARQGRSDIVIPAFDHEEQDRRINDVKYSEDGYPTELSLKAGSGVASVSDSSISSGGPGFIGEESEADHKITVNDTIYQQSEEARLSIPPKVPLLNIEDAHPGWRFNEPLWGLKSSIPNYDVAGISGSRRNSWRLESSSPDPWRYEDSSVEGSDLLEESDDDRDSRRKRKPSSRRTQPLEARSLRRKDTMPSSVKKRERSERSYPEILPQTYYSPRYGLRRTPSPEYVQYSRSYGPEDVRWAPRGSEDKPKNPSKPKLGRTSTFAY